MSIIVFVEICCDLKNVKWKLETGYEPVNLSGCYPAEFQIVSLR